MIIVSGTATVKPGTATALKDAMTTMITASRAERGCIDYRYGIDVLNPDQIVVLEYWDSWAALEAHFKMPHMAEWREALSGAILSRDIKASEAGETKDL